MHWTLFLSSEFNSWHYFRNFEKLKVKSRLFLMRVFNSDFQRCFESSCRLVSSSQHWIWNKRERFTWCYIPGSFEIKLLLSFRLTSFLTFESRFELTQKKFWVLIYWELIQIWILILHLVSQIKCLIAKFKAHLKVAIFLIFLLPFKTLRNNFKLNAFTSNTSSLVYLIKHLSRF